MFVVLSHVDDTSSRYVEELVPRLRSYWGQRGIATHPMVFDQTVKEAALAASYHLRNGNEAIFGKNTDPVPAGLAEAIYRWGSLDVSHDVWMQVLAARAKKETAVWVENSLTHVVLVTGVVATQVRAYAPKYLGRHLHMMVGSEEGPLCVKNSDLDSKWLGEAVKHIASEFSKRQLAGFSEEGV